MAKRRWYSLLVLVIGLNFNVGISLLSAQEPYYKGKTVRITVGQAAGGGVDAEARLLARYLEQHTLGNPTILVQNMPGAGGMVEANWFEQFAKPDGLTLRYESTSAISQQVFGVEGMKFDLRNWPVVGSIFRQPSVALIRPEKLPRLTGPGVPLKVGVRLGVENWNSIFLWGAEFLNWNLTWVMGYPGGGEIRLAFRRGETDIFATGVPPDLKEFVGEGFKPFVQQGRLTPAGAFEGRPGFREVPTFDELLGQRRPKGAAWQAYSSWAGADSAGRPLQAAAGTAPEIIAALREGFSRTKQDKGFQSELLKVAGEGTEVLLASEAEPILRQLLTVSPEVRDFANSLIKKYLKH